MRCVNCQSLGRVTVPAEEHRRCEKCGSPVRGATLEAPDRDVPTAEPLVWLVPSEAGTFHTEIAVRNTGTEAARVDAVSSSDEAACHCDWAPQSIPPQGRPGAGLETNGARVGSGFAVELIPVGNVEPTRRTVMVQPAPKSIAVSAPESDAWGRLLVDSHEGTVSRVEATAEYAGGTLAYRCPRLDLAVWRSGLARVEIAPAFDQPRHSPVAAVRAAADGRVDCSNESVTARIRQGGLGSQPLLLELQAQPDAVPDDGLTVGVSLVLDSLGSPRIELEVRLLPGLPEVVCSLPEPGQALRRIRLPVGHFSLVKVKRVGYGGGGAGAALVARIEEMTLRVRAVEENAEIRVRPPPVRTGGWIAGLPQVSSIRVKPVAAGSCDLTVEACAHLKGSAEPVLVSERVTVKAEGISGAEDANYAAIVDFGTTFTCLQPYDGRNEPEGDPLPLPDLVQPGRSPSQIPTELHIREIPGNGRGDPVCYIGDFNDPRFENVFRLFKPEIGEGRTETVTCGSRTEEYTSEALTTFFLRELLLEARYRLGNALFRKFRVTCPTAFNEKQRKALEKIVSELGPWGVVETGKVLLDEANAGAYCDLRGRAHLVQEGGERPVYAMIFDFGGGTIDIALLRMSRSGEFHYAVEPMGLTGIRDFGGRNVTNAIAALIEERLIGVLEEAAKSAREGDKARKTDAFAPSLSPGKKGFIPLLARVGDRSEYSAVARENRRKFRMLAEDIKRRIYGDLGPVMDGDGRVAIPDSDDWYADFEKDLTGLFTRRVVSGALLGLPTALKEVSPREFGEVPPTAYHNWISKLGITREMVDAMIEPALREAFERALNLWRRTMIREKEDHDRPPDLFFLAGNSSQIPLVLKLAKLPRGEGGLGMEAIEFSIRDAKSKVARGAAFYMHDRGMAGPGVRPRETTEFVLIPISTQEGGDYVEIFRSGHMVAREGREGAPPTGDGSVEYVYRWEPDGADRRMRLRFFENMDHRDHGWTPDAVLQQLGMSAPGKEPLAVFTVEIRGAPRVIHTVEQRDAVRHLIVEYDGPPGDPGVQDKEI